MNLQKLYLEHCASEQARRAILQYELWYDLLKLFGGENDLHIYLTCHIRLKMEKLPQKSKINDLKKISS